MDVTFFRKKAMIGCLIVFVTLLAGCSVQKNNEEYFQKYETRKLDISELGDGLINVLYVQDGDICFNFSSYADNSRSLYHMDADGLKPERMLLENVIEDKYLWMGSHPSDDKQYIVSYNQESVVHLNELNEKDQLVTQINLGDVIPDYLSMPYTFRTDKNGLLYFITLTKVYVLDEHGTLLCSQTYDELIFGYQDIENEVHIVEPSKKTDFVYDESENKFVKRGKYKIYDFSNIESVFDGSDEFSFYYVQKSDKKGREIYGVKDNTSYLLCNLSDAGMNATSASTEFYALGNDKFLFTIQTNSIDDFVVLEPSNRADRDSKQTITMAGIGIPDEIKNAANRFNIDNRDIQIDVVDYLYVYHYKYDEAYKNLNLHLLDKQTDLLCLNNYNKRNLVNKGMLEDLAPFLDRSERIKRSEFLDCVLDNCTMEDGKIYSLFPQFQIRTFMKNGQGEDESVYEMLNEHDVNENQKLFLSGGADGLLYSLIKYNPEQLMNYENGICTFDGAYFEKVLSILQNMDSYSLASNDIAEVVQNNKIKYFQMPVNDIYDYILYLQMCDYEIEFIGYPTEKGMHPVMQASSELGIPAASDKKEYAWGFLEFLLEEEHYDDLFGGEAFPVRNDSMEELLERMSATETYTKEDGTVIQAVEYSIGINDYDVEAKALREEDVVKFKDMLDRSVICDGLSEEQIDIIWEEVQSFLDGSQDKESTVRNIQSRISVTLQE